MVALLALAAMATACADGSKTVEPPTRSAAAAWLQDHPRIADALVWDAGDGQGAKPFASWSTADKATLERAVADATNDTEPVLADPPVNLMANVLPVDAPAATVLSPSDARGLYFAHVGRSLMLEMTRTLPWSIADYAPADLAVLLDSRSSFLWRQNALGRGISGYAIYDDDATFIAPDDPSSALGFVVPAPPKVTAQFLAANDIVAGDRLTTIQRMLEWERVNLNHFAGEFTMSSTVSYWQYAGAAPVSRMLAGTTVTSGYPAPVFGHWTVGCPGTNWFMMAVLRAVNIPVRYVVVEEHATPYFATEGKYLSHGDDPYNRYWSPSTPRTPASELLIDKTTYDRWFSTALPPDQRLASIGRRTKELGIQHLSDWVLRRRCTDIEAGVTNHAQSAVYADLRRIYSVAELEGIDLWNRLDAKLASLGGCSRVPPAAANPPPP
jgi:hypothetical protein